MLASKTILKARPLERGAANVHGGIAWDENNLGENDAYLASTTRQKIIEPKTPYNGQLDHEALDDEEIACAQLERRLSDEQKGRLLPSGVDLGALTDEALRRRDDGGSAISPLGSPSADPEAFAAKRSAHYDEFRRVRELRAKGALEEDEDA